MSHLVEHSPRALFTLVILALVLGLLHNSLRTHPLALTSPLPVLAPGDISLSQAKTKLSEPKYVFVDARSETAFKKSHIPGALWLSPGSLHNRFPRLAPQLRGKTIVAYCNGPRCPKADDVKISLNARGFADVRILRVGFSAWEKAKLPTESEQ